MLAMAGIAGWVAWGRNLKSETETLSHMVSTLSHRGPDAEGIWTSDEAALAHRRIAKIEAPQPFSCPNERGKACVLVFDGALSNAHDLRKEIESAGQRIDVGHDAELILRGYFVWGRDIVNRLSGACALAIWDEGEKELFLARDRLGLKPIYYVRRDESLLFGSEPKALLAHPSVVPELDETGVAELFATSFAHTPGSAIFRGMNELPPAHWLVFGKSGARTGRYWQVESQKHTDDLETTTLRIRELLDDSVRRKLATDEATCTLLSGGLDSSAITAIAAKALDEQKRGPVEAYAVEMRGASEWFVPTEVQPDLDSAWAQKMADHLGARYRVLTLDAEDVLKEFFAPLAARDFPSMGEMDVSLYLLCREITKQHAIVLSGESADEVFGGYPFFFDERALNADTFPWLVETVSHHPAELLRPELSARIRPDEYLKARYREALAETPKLEGESGNDARIREVFYLVRSRFLPMLIDRKDRMSMASGLQARMPFSDHRLHEYLWNVPWEMKCYRDREKGILRKALEGILPDDVLWRKKSGYPSMHDPAFTSAIHEKLAKRLDDPKAPLVPLIDVAKVRQRLERMKRAPSAGGIGGESHLFAYLLQIDEWLTRYGVRLIL